MESAIKDILQKITDGMRRSRYTPPVVPYDMDVTRQIVTAIGNGYIKDYRIDPDNRKQIESIIRYFHHDPEFDGDLSKGLLLIGPKGTGKTLIMLIMAKMINMFPDKFQQNGYEENLNKFTVEQTKKLTELYETQGHDGIRKYTGNLIYCFDDLGEESKVSKFYAQEVNVMSNILTTRYSNFVTRGIITHATSNYPFADSVNGTRFYEEFYGSRVDDRMVEMFNVIMFKGKTRRK